MVRIVGSVLVRNEDLFVEQAIRNVAAFCDVIHVVDHASDDRTWSIVESLARELEHVDARRSRNSAVAHRLLEGYAGTDTWVLGVDGDELYDPAGLADLRRDLDDGGHAEVFRLKAHVLNCDELDRSACTAWGWLAPPSRPVTKLFNFAAVESWRGSPIRSRAAMWCSVRASSGSRDGPSRTTRTGTVIPCGCCTSAFCAGPAGRLRATASNGPTGRVARIRSGPGGDAQEDIATAATTGASRRARAPRPQLEAGVVHPRRPRLGRRLAVPEALMADDPSTSIILATYERADALELVLTSLSEQASSALEIVVADDGSGDEIAATVARWRDRLEIRHVWQPQQGFRKSRALNLAALSARGEQLIFLDADCIPRRGFLAAIRRARSSRVVPHDQASLPGRRLHAAHPGRALARLAVVCRNVAPARPSRAGSPRLSHSGA
jgi:glycosyltransferase involved in cell wall biosynthesis